MRSCIKLCVLSITLLFLIGNARSLPAADPKSSSDELCGQQDSAKGEREGMEKHCSVDEAKVRPEKQQDQFKSQKQLKDEPGNFLLLFLQILRVQK